MKGLEILPNVVPSGSLEDFFQSLARVLAARVIDRERRGLYRSYLDERDTLPYVRGRLNLSEALSRPHRVRLPCHLEENTADLSDNQILAWTLHVVLLTGICRKDTETLVGKSFHALRNSVSLRPFKSGIGVQVQDSIKLGEQRAFEFVIDICLRDRATGGCVAVLDTKYKVDEKPSNDDISQVATYAVAKDSECAILVYPQVQSYQAVVTVGPVRVLALGYPIGGDLEDAGEQMLRRLLKVIGWRQTNGRKRDCKPGKLGSDTGVEGRKPEGLFG